jgi:hypothetical protein
MRKLFITALMLTGFAFSTQAQEKNAIGIRLGDNSGFGGEVTFQTALSKNNRIELDLGFRNQGNVYYGYGYGNGYNYGNKGYGHNDVKLVGIYQWVFDIKNGFKWYIGPGVGAGIYSSKNYYNPVNDQYETKNGAFGVITGDVGIEYNFKFPLQLSFDVRPELYLSPDYVDARDNSFGPDLGLSARYRF